MGEVVPVLAEESDVFPVLVNLQAIPIDTSLRGTTSGVRGGSLRILGDIGMMKRILVGTREHTRDGDMCTAVMTLAGRLLRAAESASGPELSA